MLVSFVFKLEAYISEIDKGPFSPARLVVCFNCGLLGASKLPSKVLGFVEWELKMLVYLEIMMLG